MVTDAGTNMVWVADSLTKMHPAFSKRLIELLDSSNVKNNLLPCTKDIWAVDYMPVQTTSDSFVAFRYAPDYLNSVVGKRTITNVHDVCNKLKIPFKESDIKLDGGNVVKGENVVFICDKVFRENNEYLDKVLIEELYELFQVDKVVFLPTHPQDFTGHADGIVRVIDDKNVLINRYVNCDSEYSLKLKLTLHNAGVNWQEFAYNPYSNRTYYDANGVYLNYLQTDRLIVLPTYHIPDDEIAYNTMSSVFPNTPIATISCNEIALKGGVLNCITWNILI